jgi:periplasmic copper chaperone A
MARMSRAIARLGLVPATAVAVLALAGPASAHVTITATETAAGAYTILMVSVPHGCEGSPTTEVAIQLPDGITEVTPTRNAFYDVEVVTEGVSQVLYTARTPLPDGQRDTFELALQIPEEAAGRTLAFPTVQTCEEGSTAWTEVAADGQSADDLEHPAPAFLVTGATAADAADEDDDSVDPLAVTGLVAGLLGLALGATALARTRGDRKRPGNSSGAGTGA